jgi:prepilin-type processing-associated H-X9-DG protein
MPILARGQVVNVLYADGGRGGHVNPDGVGELLILAAKIAQSYDALLARAR